MAVAGTDSLQSIMQSFATGVKNLGEKTKSAAGTGVERVKGDIGGIVDRRREQAKLTSDQMIDASLGQSPLLAGMAGGGVDMIKSAFGMLKEGDEAEPTQIVKDMGAGEDIVSSNESLNVIKDLLSHIAIDTEGLVNLNTELLAAWVDQATLERIMHEELMADSAADRLRQIEESRERNRGSSGGGSDGIVPAGPESSDGGGGLLGKLGGIFKQIPGFGAVSGLFSGGLGGIAKLFSKLFFPITMVMGVISFVSGFMEGYQEDGLIGGITGGFEKLIGSLIDVPLNFLTSVVAWIAGALGFEDVEKTLNEFLDGGGFNLASIVDPIVQFFVWLGETVAAIPGQMMDFVKDSAGSILPDFLNPWAGDEETTPEPKPTPKSVKKAPEPQIAQVDPDELGLVHASPMGAAPEKMSHGYTESEWRAMPKEERLKKGKERRRAKKVARVKSNIADLESSKSDFESRAANLREGIEGGDDSEETRRNLESLTKHAARYEELIAEKQNRLEQLTGGDPRAGAAAAMQEAGLDKSSGGAGANIVVNNVDQSQSGGGSAPIPIPIDMQSDPTLAAPAQ